MADATTTPPVARPADAPLADDAARRGDAPPPSVVVAFLPGGEMAQVPAGTPLLDAAPPPASRSTLPAAARAAAAAAA